MLIDTHCHLDFEWFEDDRSAVVARARQASVERIIVPAVDLNNCEAVIDLADEYDEVFAAVGIHPNSSRGWQEGWIDTIEDFATHPKVVAIGEIGLDYYRDESPVSTQQEAFAAQLALAAKMGLPVIVHNRESDTDVLRLLAASPLSGLPAPGVLHSFSASQAVADKALGFGYYLGFTGPVTYKKAEELRQVVSRVPLNRTLIETDAPFLAPQRRRGQRNEPAYVSEVADQIAAIHGLPLKIIEQKTTENALRLFGPRLSL